MKKNFLLLGSVALLNALVGCSKSKEATTEAAPATVETGTAATAAPLGQPNASANAAMNSLPQVTQAMQNRQYENAVLTLNQIQPLTAQMSEAQRLQYQQARQDATAALIQVMNQDPAAKAAYENLSRAATGR